MMMNKLLECVPNYSEGRDMQKVEQIVDCFRGKKGVKLLDYQTDKGSQPLRCDCNRRAGGFKGRSHCFLWKGCRAD